MKILLRETGSEYYVWKTATHNGKHFVVDGRAVDIWRVVSVMNDNRKNHIICSSCGAVFPKRGNKFAKHKAESEGIKPCLNCKSRSLYDERDEKNSYVLNVDGTITRKSTSIVEFMCTKNLWNNYRIESQNAINRCAKRRCKDAAGVEITDAFTMFPGLFDDIITVDSILNNGYEEITFSDEYITEYLLNRELEIHAVVNPIGIVDRFIVHGLTDYGDVVYYSKKYDGLFQGGTTDYVPYVCDKYTEIIEYIRKLYK